MDKTKAIEKLKKEIFILEQEIFYRERKLSSLRRELDYYTDNSFNSLLEQFLDNIDNEDNYYNTYRYSPRRDKIVVRIDKIIEDKKLRLYFERKLEELHFVKGVERAKAVSWNNKTIRCLVIDLKSIDKLKMYSSEMIE